MYPFMFKSLKFELDHDTIVEVSHPARQTLFHPKHSKHNKVITRIKAEVAAAVSSKDNRVEASQASRKLTMADIDVADIDLLDFFSNDDQPSTSAAPLATQYSVQHTTQQQNTNRHPPGSAAHTTLPPSRGGGGDTAVNSPSNAARPLNTANNNNRSSNNSNISKSGPTAAVADFTETYSGLRVRNRLLSAEDMRVRMKGRKVHRLDALRVAPLGALQSDDPSDAWATLGVLVSKSPRRQAANGGSYSIWTLSDLSRKENDLSVFLFQEALGSHWTVCTGTLLAVVGAKVLPPKAGDGGGKGKLSLSVETPWQIHKVGMAMDYALCKGTRKDGKPCTMPVNKTEGGHCEFHVVAAFNRAQRQGQERSRNKPKDGSSSNGQTLRSLLMGNAAAGRKAASIPARSLPAARTPAPSLAGILGAARRRDDVGGAARFGTAMATNAATSSTAGAVVRSPAEIKILRPTAVRAAGRTTVLSSLPAGGSRPSNGGGPRRLVDKVSGRLGDVVAGRKEGQADKSGDPLGLPWAYGGGGEGSGTKRKRAGDATGGQEEGRLGKKAGKSSRADGGDGDRESKKRALDIDLRLNSEAHPNGLMSGSVPVPKPSNVYKKMADMFQIRPEARKSEAGARQIAQAQVEMSQQRVKAIAQARGIIIRPADPNATNSRQSIPILGQGKRGRSSAIIGGNAVLNAAGGRKISTMNSSKASDPLASKVKTMSTVEKELLLRRVSKYAGLVEEEKANEADKSMQRLEQREALADKAEEVTKMTVTAWNCAQCKTRRTFFSKRCKELGHEQTGAKATLRFFECTNCRRRTKTTERVPHLGCEGCGRHNEWKRCGARPGRGPVEGPRDKRFVTAMSEWTDQRDLSLAAPDLR